MITVNTVNFMKTGEMGIELIKKYEGLSLKAYRCPAGVWTIGYGSTRGVSRWSVISRADAESRLREDIARIEPAVDQVVYLQKGIRQCQYDALISFVFNLGIGAFGQSALRRRVVHDPDNPLIAKEFLRWVYIDGKVSTGLQNRRREETELYFLYTRSL